jgi:cell division protein ZapE
VPTADSPGPVILALNDRVQRHILSPDLNQSRAAKILDRIAASVAHPRRGIFARKNSVRGAYLVGEVGRGKTRRTDLFFAAVETEKKRRVHFHEFMDEVHTAIAAFRKTERGQGDTDPIAAVTKPIVASTRLLCLDEFQVQDITNAMILGRLFEKLFAGGVTLVATSNTAPDDLYRNGLNRQLFLPFIALLKDNAEIVRLDGGTDYRRLKFEGQEVYHFGTGPRVEAGMDTLWLRLTGGEPGAPAEIESLGRKIHVPLAAMGAARFPFADLCETPLGARDYLRIAHAFDTLMIDNVPRFDRLRSDASKRFILLIDTLYDRGIKLAASFAAPLDELARDDRTAADFARTTSRLIEMQSETYLSAPHKAEATAEIEA